MKLRNGLLISAAVSALLLTTACGNTLKAGATSLVDNGDPSGRGDNSQNPPTKEDLWASIETVGLVSNSPFGSYKAVTIDKVTKIITIQAPLPASPLGAFKEDVKEIPGATLEVAQDTAGSWFLRVNIPLKYIVKGVDMAAPDKLPNGNPLPKIPGGELPKLGLHIQKTNYEFYLYLSSTIVGIYVPTPGFNPTLNLDFPVKNRTKTKILGYFSTVKKEGTFDGGFFTSFVLPPALSRAIDDVF